MNLNTMQPTIYLDMDGCLSNFEKEMYKISETSFDDASFRLAVKNHRIFEKLELMPNAPKLLNKVKWFNDVNRQILTSVGIENDPEHYRLASTQKTNWLQRNGIFYIPNFVERMTKKGNYATEHSILIDDTIRAVEAFRANGGIGILHSDDKIQDTLDQLEEAVYNIKTKIAKLYV